MYTYLHNSYNTPTMLYPENGDHILSQGDNAAMAMYALSTRPLIQTLSNETANDEVKQVWYADNSSAVGSLAGVRKSMVGIPEGQGARLWVLPKTYKDHLHNKRQ